MMNKLSIRVRLVIITVIVLTLCCIGLTLIINYSATKMATQVAEVMVPAININEKEDVKNLVITQAQNMELDLDVKRQEEIMDTFYRNSILYMLFIIASGGLMMYIFSEKMIFPLTELNKKIKSITAMNLSDKVIVPDTDDEIAELTISFNKMTDRIEETFIFQQQFSANVAHELRTPLTILKTKIEVFDKKEDRSLIEHRQLISDLKNQITRLSDIVQTLLWLTNSDGVKEKEHISLYDIIESILIELSNISAEKNISLSMDLQDVEVYGNVDLLYQVFYNIIQNSINYNVEKGGISIWAEEKEEKTIIKICDTGIGIPKDKKESVFEPFFRMDKSRSRLIGGAGLGLSIVKNIIDKHSGKIVISDNEPDGTCFTIELPLKG